MTDVKKMCGMVTKRKKLVDRTFDQRVKVQKLFGLANLKHICLPFQPQL